MGHTVCPTTTTTTTTNAPDIIERLATSDNTTTNALIGRIGKVVASHAAVARSIPAEVALIYICTRRSGSTAHEGGGQDQSIESTVSDAIVRSWLWLTATRSSPLGCFSTLLLEVDNRPHILWGRLFSTGGVLAIEDFLPLIYLIL